MPNSSEHDACQQDLTTPQAAIERVNGLFVFILNAGVNRIDGRCTHRIGQS